ncbi:MAG: hypothetical protein JWQ81_5173 [Amycolatopsis sp.]|jgi:hypothetical protein|nr:hypothetical protein [Amycolatopsis sp.]MCU1684434.1 hypothetical protein [Amycolatopsis sp.]
MSEEKTNPESEENAAAAVSDPEVVAHAEGSEEDAQFCLIHSY